MAPGTKGSKNDLFSGPPFFVFFRVFSTFFTFFGKNFSDSWQHSPGPGFRCHKKLDNQKIETKKKDQRNPYESQKPKLKNQINEKK
jgi:hypothetical protein